MNYICTNNKNHVRFLLLTTICVHTYFKISLSHQQRRPASVAQRVTESETEPAKDILRLRQVFTLNFLLNF